MKNIMITKFEQFLKENKLENPPTMIVHGEYLTLIQKDNKLDIELNKRGYEKLEDLEGELKEGDKLTNNELSEDLFAELFETIETNSDYKFIYNLGDAGFGLTEAPGIIYAYDLDENGEYVETEDSQVL